MNVVRAVSIAIVFASGPCALAQTTLLSVPNQVVGRRFFRTAPTGDVDGDGVPDVSVSGIGFGSIYSGATGAHVHTFLTPAISNIGFAIGTIDRLGDLDGDGHDDITFGAPDEAPGGHVKVYSGKTGAILHDLVGDAPPGAGLNFLGYEVVGLGDVNGDGVPDFGASRYSFAASTPLAVFVYDGVTGAAIFSNLDTSNASAPNIARAGDVNGDGRADVLVAYTDTPTLGSCASVVQLLSGVGGTVLRSYEDPFTCGEGAGLLGGADFDGDGTPDVVVGSPYGAWKGPFDAGRITGYSGATGEVLFVREALSESGGLGASMAIAGDVNGDGSVDLACGQPDLPTAAGSNAGGVVVFSAGARARFELALEGLARDERYGTSVAAPGDLDGDGVDELTVTAPAPWSDSIPLGTLTAHSIAKANPGEDRFVPGSTLRGTIAASDDADGATFAALAGLKLRLQFEVTLGALAPRVRVESSDGEHVVTWAPKASGVSNKTISLKRDGNYVLRVEGKHGTTGSYRIATKWLGLKQVPKALVKTVEGKNGNPPRVKFRVLAGTLIQGSVESLAGPLVAPALELRTTAGTVTSLAPFADPAELGDTETWIDGILAAESGGHELTVVAGPDAPTKARFVFDLDPPRGTELLDID